MTRIQLCLTCSIHPVHCRAILIYWLFTLSLEKKAQRDTEGPENHHASLSPIQPKSAFFFFLSWKLITLQYCSGFCHTLKWISHGFTYVPHPDPRSHLPLHPIPLGLPSAPGPGSIKDWMCVLQIHALEPNCQSTVFWKAFQLFGMPWSIAHQTPLSMGFLRQENWRGLQFPSPGNLPDSRIEPRSLPLWADCYRLSHQQSPLRLNELLGWNTHPIGSVSSWSETPENFSSVSVSVCPFLCPSFPPPPCVKTHRKAILGRKSSYQNLTLLGPWSGTSSPQSCGEIHFWCLFHWVYFILLWHS